MIVHIHSDKSEGYQYEIGDQVEIIGCIGGSWFQRVIGRIGTVESFERGPDNWRIGVINIRYSKDWGPARVLPWQIKPIEITRANAKTVHL